MFAVILSIVSLFAFCYALSKVGVAFPSQKCADISVRDITDTLDAAGNIVPVFIGGRVGCKETIAFEPIEEYRGFYSNLSSLDWKVRGWDSSWD